MNSMSFHTKKKIISHQILLTVESEKASYISYTNVSILDLRKKVSST